MSNQDIKITEIKADGVVIEEKIIYEKNVGQLKDEIRDLGYRKESLMNSMLQMKNDYQAFDERQKKLIEVVEKLEAEEKPQTVDDIFENL